MIRQEEHSKKIFDFLNGVGPPRLFFFHRCPYEHIKDSKEIRTTSLDKEFAVNYGETEILQDKTVYFVRTTGNKGVNAAADVDSDVLTGVIPAAAVNVLEVLLNGVLIPMIENNEDWGVCEDDNKKEFLTYIKKFSQDFHEAIDTLAGGVELEKLDPKYEAEARASSKQPSEACIKNCRDLVKSWMQTIDEYINGWKEPEEKKPEPNEEGPLDRKSVV